MPGGHYEEKETYRQTDRQVKVGGGGVWLCVVVREVVGCGVVIDGI